MSVVFVMDVGYRLSSYRRSMEHGNRVRINSMWRHGPARRGNRWHVGDEENVGIIVTYEAVVCGLSGRIRIHKRCVFASSSLASMEWTNGFCDKAHKNYYLCEFYGRVDCRVVHRRRCHFLQTPPDRVHRTVKTVRRVGEINMNVEHRICECKTRS